MEKEKNTDIFENTGTAEVKDIDGLAQKAEANGVLEASEDAVINAGQKPDKVYGAKEATPDGDSDKSGERHALDIRLCDDIFNNSLPAKTDNGEHHVLYHTSAEHGHAPRCGRMQGRSHGRRKSTAATGGLIAKTALILVVVSALTFATVLFCDTLGYFRTSGTGFRETVADFWYGGNSLEIDFSNLLLREVYFGNRDVISGKSTSGSIGNSKSASEGNTSSPNNSEETSENDKNSSIYDFDYSKVPSGAVPIIPYDLSLPSYGNGYIYNDTSYAPSPKAPELPDYNENDPSPLVLIVHTHGTEAYSTSDAEYYFEGDGELARTKDTSSNVVAVGEVISEILNDNGIPTLHCEIMHDEESYRDSYNRSSATIKEYLAKYPTIKYVFDVHRDSIVKSSGELVRSLTEIDGERAAQIMFVVGSDENGTYYPTWKNNLNLSLDLREELNKLSGSFVRPTYLRQSSYNQELAEVSLLIEVGSSGNSLEEAKAAAVYLATALANIIKGKQ